MLRNPFASLSISELESARISIQKKAEEDFKASFSRLIQLTQRQDPELLLSSLAFYFLVWNPEQDPEAQSAGRPFPHHIELIQCIALSKPGDTPYDIPLRPKAVQEIIDTVLAVELANRFRRLPVNREGQEVDKAILQEHVRAYTGGVRHWGYPHQEFKIARDLILPIDAQIDREVGLPGSLLVDFLEGLVRLIEKRVNERREQLRWVFRGEDTKTVLHRYGTVFPESAAPSFVEGLEEQDLESLTKVLLLHSELYLPDLYRISPRDIRQLTDREIEDSDAEHILDKWSYEFGDLESFDPEHFFFGLPVQDRPFIRLRKGVYSIPNAGLLAHSVLRLLEAQLVATPLIKTYEKRRARYLEEEVYRHFKAGFPSAQLVRGVKWTEPVTGKGYETDLFLLIDRTAIIVESKSGKFTDPARRGADKRLAEELDELVLEPGRQANRFRSYLLDLADEVTLEGRNEETITFKPNGVDRIVALAVNLDLLGPLVSRIEEAKDAGLLGELPEPRVPCMSLVDLEIVMDLLSTQAERIHYLARRAELEVNLYYYGDESDLLAFYLKTGFNIGEVEYESKQQFVIAGMSRELDPFYTATYEGLEPVEKPVLSISGWWKDILARGEQSGFSGWTEAAYALLCVGEDDQLKFSRKLNQLCKRVRSGKTKRKYHWIELVAGPKRRRYTIMAFPYSDDTPVERKQFIGERVDRIFEEQGEVQGVVVLAMPLKTDVYPYGSLAYLSRSSWERQRESL